MITQTFDLVLKRTVSSRRLSCVPSTYVLPDQATSYHCLCYENSLLVSKLWLLKRLTWCSKEPSHRDDFLVYHHHVFCLVEQLFTATLATNTAYLGLNYVYSNIWLGSQENRLIETIFLCTFNMCIARSSNRSQFQRTLIQRLLDWCTIP